MRLELEQKGQVIEVFWLDENIDCTLYFLILSASWCVSYTTISFMKVLPQPWESEKLFLEMRDLR